MTAGSEESPRVTRRTLGRLAVAVVLLGGIMLGTATGLADSLKVETLNAYRADLLAFVAAHRAVALAAFMLVYTAGVALSIPAWGLLTVLGGFLFGPWIGTAAVVSSAAVGGTIVFLATRYAFGDLLRARAEPLLRAFGAESNADAFSFILALQLMPVFPFFLINLGAAFLPVTTRTFFAATVLGLIPGTLVYATLGAGLGDAIEASTVDPLAAAREPTVVGGLTGLALLALVPIAYRRFKRRRANR
jgi:uncharacterized membrane protein YdjX (TVP38/TMEM64 family)